MVALIAIAGFWGYNSYFKPDPKVQQQLKSQFGADFFNVSVDQTGTADAGAANNSNSKVNTANGKTVAGESGKGGTPSESSQNQNQSNQVQSGQIQNASEKLAAEASTSGNNNAAANSITQDEIVQKYMPKINGLQNIALSRLDALYSAAIQEYRQDKNNGTLNRSQLAQKYIQAGTMLEGSVDGQFNKILNSLQAELVANHFPTDEVNVIKNEYEKAKSQRRAQLLSKALK